MSFFIIVVFALGKKRESRWAKKKTKKKTDQTEPGRKRKRQMRERKDIAGGYLIAGISQLGEGERRAVLGEKKINKEKQTHKQRKYDAQKNL